MFEPKGTIENGRVGNLIEYFPGTLPIILTSPHGGLKPTDEQFKKYTILKAALGDRSLNDYQDKKFGTSHFDTGTRELTMGIANHLEYLTGMRPHVIRTNLSRSFLNMNRNKSEGTIPAKGPVHPDIDKSYDDYINFIEKARQSVIEKYNTGHLFDIHGQVSRGRRTHLGSHTLHTQINKKGLDEDTKFTRDVINKSSAKHLLQSGNINFYDYTIGERSLGSFLSARGIRVIPSATERIIKKDTRKNKGIFWSGGWTSFTQGSKKEGVINSTQVENYSGYIHKGYSAVNEQTIEDYCKDWAESLLDFFEDSYKMSFPRKSINSDNNPIHQIISYSTTCKTKPFAKYKPKKGYVRFEEAKKFCKYNNCKYFVIDVKNKACTVYKECIPEKKAYCNLYNLSLIPEEEKDFSDDSDDSDEEISDVTNTDTEEYDTDVESCHDDEIESLDEENKEEIESCCDDEIESSDEEYNKEDKREKAYELFEQLINILS